MFKTVELRNSFRNISEVKDFKLKLKSYFDDEADALEIMTLEYTMEVLEENAESLLESGLGDESLFLLVEDKIVGFASLGGIDGYEELEKEAFNYILNVIYIYPKYRERGFGTKMMKEIEHQFSGSKIYLTPTTDSENYFYETLGYKPYGDSVSFWKKL